MYRKLLRSQIENFSISKIQLDMDFQSGFLSDKEHYDLWIDVCCKQLELIDSYVYILTAARKIINNEEYEFLVNNSISNREHYLN